MSHTKFISELCLETDSKIVLLVLDGLGGLPINGKTSLETAATPNLNKLAAQGACGLTDPVFRGITPGSGPAHLSLFGYDPVRYQLGRGILEALGVDVEVGESDLVARGNFATMKNGLIIDRRAGRIPTSENERLCLTLNEKIRPIEGTQISFYPGREHRFVVKFSKDGLSDALSDADPQKTNTPEIYTTPLSPEANNTAKLVNAFLDEATNILKGNPKANTVLLRGFAKYPDLPAMDTLYKLKPAAIANYPMYMGLAKLAGMSVLNVGAEIEDLFNTLEEYYNNFNFFYVHVKKTDSAGEDGNYEAKKATIEKIDSLIPRILALKPEVLVITSDHSTPCLMKSHSWHPNPFLIWGQTAQPDTVTSFTEKDCSRGYLGRFHAVEAMPLMLAHAGKLKKYGA